MIEIDRKETQIQTQTDNQRHSDPQRKTTRALIENNDTQTQSHTQKKNTHTHRAMIDRHTSGVAVEYAART